jgi:hypothetical protein
VSWSKNTVREDADEIFRILVSRSHSYNASCLGTWMNTPNGSQGFDHRIGENSALSTRAAGQAKIANYRLPHLITN